MLSPEPMSLHIEVVFTVYFIIYIYLRQCIYYILHRAGEKITVTPSSKELLFYPPEVEATITGGKTHHTVI